MTGPRLHRGDVYRMPFPYPQDPNRATPVIKWVVILQGGRYWQGRQSILVAVATSQQPIVPYPHFVEVQVGDGGFATRSWIDCGDLYRIRRDRFNAADAEHVGALPPAVLDEVDDALLVGTGIEDGANYLS